MMDLTQEDPANVILAFASVALLLLLLLSIAVGWAQDVLSSWKAQHGARRPPPKQDDRPPVSAPNERTNPPNAAPGRRTDDRTDDRTGSFALNADERGAVARMIDHKTTAENPTKASAIYAGFGLKKGESAKYKRASLIYDELFILPPPPESPSQYRELDEERRPILN